MLKKNSKIELEQFLLETDTPPQGVSLAKRLLLAGILITGWLIDGPCRL